MNTVLTITLIVVLAVLMIAAFYIWIAAAALAVIVLGALLVMLNQGRKDNFSEAMYP